MAKNCEMVWLIATSDGGHNYELPVTFEIAKASASDIRKDMKF